MKLNLQCNNKTKWLVMELIITRTIHLGGISNHHFQMKLWLGCGFHQNNVEMIMNEMLTHLRSLNGYDVHRPALMIIKMRNFAKEF